MEKSGMEKYTIKMEILNSKLIMEMEKEKNIINLVN